MAFYKKEESDFLILLLTTTLITVPVLATTNIDCKGKAFHCLNSTHFKVCVDFGGVSKTVDDFLIPCPPSTVCSDDNVFECEYQISTTSAIVTTQSDVTNELSEINVSSVTESLYDTKSLSVNNNDTTTIELLENISTIPIVFDAVVSDTAKLDNYTSANDLNNEPIDIEQHDAKINSLTVSDSSYFRPTVEILNDTPTSTTITSATINNLSSNISSKVVLNEDYSGTQSKIPLTLINTIKTTPSNTDTATGGWKKADLKYTKLFSPVITDNLNNQQAAFTTQNYPGNDLSIGVHKPVITTPMNFPVRTDTSSTLPATVKAIFYPGTEISTDLYKYVALTPTNNRRGEDSTPNKLPSPVKTDDLRLNNSLITAATNIDTLTESEVLTDLFDPVETTSLPNLKIVQSNKDYNLISPQLYTTVNPPTETSTTANEFNAMTITNKNVTTKTLQTLDESSMHRNSTYTNKIDKTSPVTKKWDTIGTTPSNTANDKEADFAQLFSPEITDNLNKQHTDVKTKNYPANDLSIGDYKTETTTFMNNVVNKLLISTQSPFTVTADTSSTLPATVKTTFYQGTESEMSTDLYKNEALTPTNNREDEDLTPSTLSSAVKTDDLSPDNSPPTAATNIYTVAGSKVLTDSFDSAETTSLNNLKNVELNKDFTSTISSFDVNASQMGTENILKGSSSDTINLSSLSNYNLISLQQYTTVNPPTETSTIANEFNAMTFTNKNVTAKTFQTLDESSMHKNRTYINKIDQTSPVTKKWYTIGTTPSNTANDKEADFAQLFSPEITDNLNKQHTDVKTENYPANDLSIGVYNPETTIFMNNVVNKLFISTQSPFTVTADTSSTLPATVKTTFYQGTESEMSTDLYKNEALTPTNNREDEDLTPSTLSSSVKTDDLSPDNSPPTAATNIYTVAGSKVLTDSFDSAETTSLNNLENVELNKDFKTTISSFDVNASEMGTENILKGSSSDTINLSSLSNYNLISLQQYTTVNPPTETSTIANEFNATTFTNKNVTAKTFQTLDESSMHKNRTYINKIDQTSPVTKKWYTIGTTPSNTANDKEADFAQLFSPEITENLNKQHTDVKTENYPANDLSIGDYKPETTTFMNNVVNKLLISTQSPFNVTADTSSTLPATVKTTFYQGTESEMSTDLYKNEALTPTNNREDEDLTPSKLSFPVKTDDLSPDNSLTTAATNMYTVSGSKVLTDLFDPVEITSLNNLENVELYEDFTSTILSFDVNASEMGTENILKGSSSDTINLSSLSNYNLISLQQYTTVNPPTETSKNVTTETYQTLDESSMHKNRTYINKIDQTSPVTKKWDIIGTTPSNTAKDKEADFAQLFSPEITENLNNQHTEVKTENYPANDLSIGEYKPRTTTFMNNVVNEFLISTQSPFAETADTSITLPATTDIPATVKAIFYSGTENETLTDFYEHVALTPTYKSINEHSTPNKLFSLVKTDDLRSDKAFITAATNIYTTNGSEVLIELLDPVETISLNNLENVESNKDFISTILSSNVNVIPTVNPAVQTTSNANELSVTDINEFYTNVAINNSYKFKESTMHEISTYIKRSDQTHAISDSIRTEMPSTSAVNVVSLNSTVEGYSIKEHHLPSSFKSDTNLNIENSETKSSDILNLASTIAAYVANIHQDTIISDLPTTQEKIQLNVNLTPIVMPFAVKTNSHEMTENAVQNSSFATDSKNNLKDKEITKNILSENTTNTNRFYEANNTSSDNVKYDFLIHGNNTLLLQSMNYTFTANSTEADFLPKEPTLVYNSPIKESIRNELLESISLKSLSDTDFISTLDFSNAQRNTNMNVNFPRASTDENGLYKNFAKKNSNNTVQEISIHDYHSVNNDIKNVTLPNDFVSSMNDTLNITNGNFSLHENNVLSSAVINENSFITENMVTKSSSDTYDISVSIATDSKPARMKNENLFTSPINNGIVVYPSTTENVIKETSAYNANSDITRDAFDGTNYLSTQSYSNDYKYYGVTSPTMTENVLKYNAKTTVSSTYIPETSIVNQERITLKTSLMKTQERYDSYLPTGADKNSTLSNRKLLTDHSNTYKNDNLGSTHNVQEYPYDFVQLSHIDNMEQNDNYNNANLITALETNQSNTFKDTNNREYSILKTTQLYKIKKENTRTEIQNKSNTENDRYAMGKSKNLTKLVISTIMLIDENNNVSKLKTTPFTDYDSNNVGFTEKMTISASPEINVNFTENYSLAENVTESSILDHPIKDSSSENFSTVVTNTNNNLYGNAKNTSIESKPKSLKIDKDDLSESKVNHLTQPSKNVVNSISSSIDKDLDIVRSTLETTINEITFTRPVKHIFVSTDITSTQTSNLLYNAYINNILRPTSPLSSESHFMHNNTTPPETRNKNYIKENTKSTNIAKTNLEILKVNTITSPIPENILSESTSPIIDFVNMTKSSYDILSEKINEEKDTIEKEPTTRDSEFGGLNVTDNIEKSTLLPNQYNLILNNTIKSTMQLHEKKNSDSSANLYNLTNNINYNKFIISANTESNLNDNNDKLPALKLQDEKITFDVVHKNKMNKNLDDNYLKPTMSLISELNGQYFYKPVENRTISTNSFFKPSFNNETIINNRSNVMNLTNTVNILLNPLEIKQREKFATKSSTFDKIPISKHGNKQSLDNPVLTNEEKKIEKNTKNTTFNLIKRNDLKNYDTTKSKFNCNNRYRGRYSDKNNCQNFYICIGKHQPIFGKCPNNTVFSEISKQCTKNLSHCIRNNQFQCSSPGRYIDIFSDQFYYICVKKKEEYIRFKLKCQRGYHLNKTNLHCVLDSLTRFMSNEDSSKMDSAKSTIESKSREDQKRLVDARKEFRNFECKKEGKFVHEDDCRKYYQCTKRGHSEFRLKIKKCDSDEVFNNEKKQCVDEESYECGQ